MLPIRGNEIESDAARLNRNYPSGIVARPSVAPFAPMA